MESLNAVLLVVTPVQTFAIMCPVHSLAMYKVSIPLIAGFYCTNHHHYIMAGWIQTLKLRQMLNISTVEFEYSWLIAQWAKHLSPATIEQCYFLEEKLQVSPHCLWAVQYMYINTILLNTQTQYQVEVRFL